MMQIIQLVLMVVAFAGAWKIFTKMGKPGWAAIVPIYNAVVLVQTLNKPMVWVILCLIPFVNIIVMIELAKAFGKSAGFGVGLGLLSFVFAPMLGFGDAKFQGAPPAAAA